MSDRSYAEQLRLSGLVTRPALAEAMRSVAVADGSRGLDVGCGIGDKTLALAALGPAVSVVGVDRDPDFLAAARARAADQGLAARVRFEPGDLHALPLPDASVDWAWACDTLWPVPGIDPLAGVAELRRVVRPGGAVALAFWADHTLLPGHPLLEATLALAHTRANPYLAAVPPHLHFRRALGWLQAAGLVDARVASFTAHHAAPLDASLREALLACMHMVWWDALRAALPEPERRLLAALTDPAAPTCIVDAPDYQASVTYLVVGARVPASAPAAA